MNPGLFSWWIWAIKWSIFPDVKKAACSEPCTVWWYKMKRDAPRSSGLGCKIHRIFAFLVFLKAKEQADAEVSHPTPKWTGSSWWLPGLSQRTYRELQPGRRKTILPIPGKAAPIHLLRQEFSSTLPIPISLSSW